MDNHSLFEKNHTNQPHLNLRSKQTMLLRHKTKLIVAVSFSLLIATGLVFYLQFSNIEKTHAGNSVIRYPNLVFHDPVLVSGVAGQLNAVYKFANVDTGIDAIITILNIHNAARVDDMDHFTAGYYAAWQPFVAAGANQTSWIDWKINFKIAGTNVDSNLNQLVATAVDVDGDGAYLKEFVEANHVRAYSMISIPQLSIILNSDSCQATSTYANVANIDTNQTPAMFSMYFYNVSTIVYRTGAISNYGAEEVRQNSIYFRYFDALSLPIPIPPASLPVELLSFDVKATGQGNVDISWVTASEVNNDYFTIERSQDGKVFKELLKQPGAGNSITKLQYHAIDDAPLNGISYYRLKQTDFDGKFVNFPVKAIKNASVNSNQQLIINAINPNPFKDNFRINFTISAPANIELQILNSSGQRIYKGTIPADQGFNTYSFTDKEGFPSGVYLLRMICNGEVKTQKLIKQ